MKTGLTGDKRQGGKDDTEASSLGRWENASNYRKEVGPRRGKIISELEAKVRHTMQCPVCKDLTLIFKILTGAIYLTLILFM